jgi:NADH dehydrogenase FAD-containing subunit
MGEDAASVFFLGCFENRVTLYSQQVRALNLVDAILDQQLVREHGKVAIVGGRAAGITAAAALAKAAPELQKIDLFEARGPQTHERVA